MTTDWESEDEDEDDADDYPPNCNGPDGLRILREQCSTCIFRPGNRMQLQPGRVRDMTRRTDAEDTNVICHQTLGEPLGAMCRGSVERRPGQMVRIAYRLNAVVEVDPPAKPEADR